MDTAGNGSIEVDAAPPISSPEIDSVALQRLIAEVRNDEPIMASKYNRMHNRHNR
jgi:Zn-finger nucleic acid-binding protein